MDIQSSTQPTQYNLEPLIRAINFVKENILPFDDIKDGRRFLLELEKFLRQHPDFKNVYPDVYQEIDEIIIQLKWLCLPFQEEKAIIDLITNNFIVIFAIPNFNLLDKFKTKLTHLLDLAERDELKAKVKTAILKNNQVITTAGLVIDTHEHRGTIANWLLDYNKNLGGTKIADTLKFREYITRGQNTADLEEADKAKLLVLFSFYELLKLSSQTPEGIEESIAFVDSQGHLKILEQGIVEDVDTNKQVRDLMKLVEPVKTADIDININPIGLPRPVGADQRVRPTDVRPTDVRPTDVRPTDVQQSVGATLVVAQDDGRPNIGATTRVAPTNTDHFTFQDAQSMDQFRQPGTTFQPHQFAEKLRQVRDFVFNPQNVGANLCVRPEDKADTQVRPYGQVLTKRLDSLILTYLKGIRDEIETRQRLADNVKIGGMGFGPEIINQVFAILQGHFPFSQLAKESKQTSRQPAEFIKSRIQDKPRQVNQQKIQAPRKSSKQQNKISISPIFANKNSFKDFSLKFNKNKRATALKTKFSQEIDSEINQLNKFKELPPKPKTKFLPQSLPQENSNKTKPLVFKKSTDIKRIDFSQIYQDKNKPIRVQSRTPQKPIVQDVKAPDFVRRESISRDAANHVPRVRLIGPIQEIAGLSLADLRRAGSLEKFAEFLLSKIDDIKDISYGKKVEAIKAWKQSPLHQLYLSLGNLSLQKAVGVQELTKSLDANNNLTWEEFEGISRLNGQIGY